MKYMGKQAIAALMAAMAVGGSTMVMAAAGDDVDVRLCPQYTIMIDGTARTFYNAAGAQVHPLSYNGSVYLPVRAIGELMGKNVSWDESSKTVTIAGARTTGAVTGTPDVGAKPMEVEAELCDDFTIVIDNQKRVFKDAKNNTVYPILYRGSTYLPVRAIGELMGKKVEWNGATNTVTLSGGATVTDVDSTASNNNAGNQYIGEQKAKEIALAHAKQTAGSVSFSKVQLDWDDGRAVYEVEFYTKDFKEFDYEIDAKTGSILSYDTDAESYTRPQQGGTQISAERAKEIALKQVAGASAANVRKCELDRDDGRAVYEIEIHYGGKEYDFKIDASTGAILSREMDDLDD